MVYKIILAGRLEFGSEKTFKKVLEMYNFRVQNFYKFDLLFREEVFDEENFYLNIPRLVKQSDEKSWSNTCKLLEYLAEFAISGSVMLWKIDDSGKRKKITSVIVEPETDKVAVKSFIKGRALADQKGKENEAMQALSKAIEKYERHSLAYERRGIVNLKFKNYKDAIYDFSKSIDLNPNYAQPYYGRAKVKLIQKDLEAAVKDLDSTIKMSIPLQTIHIKARKLKTETLKKMGQIEKTEGDLRFLSNRKFDKTDSFYPFLQQTCFEYGKVLLKVDKPVDALVAFEKAMVIEVPKKNAVKESELLLHYGVALQKAGKKGFKKNWKSAAELGSKKAKALLLEHA